MKKKERSTLRSLYLSIISMFLSSAMLLGTTYAWFTSSVSTGRNIVKTGAFNATMKIFDPAAGAYVELTDANSLFTVPVDPDEASAAALVPGQSTPIRLLQIENANAFDVVARVSISGLTVKKTVVVGNNTQEIEEDEDGHPFTSELHLLVKQVYLGTEPETFNTAAEVTFVDADDKGLLADSEEGAFIYEGTLAAGESAIVAVALQLPESSVASETSNEFVIVINVTQKGATETVPEP